MSNELVYDEDLCHEFCRNNAESLKNSKMVGCYYCMSIAAKKPSYKVIDNNCVCPYCLQFSLIGDADVVLTKDLLLRMNSRWIK